MTHDATTVIRPANPEDAAAIDGVLRSLGWFDFIASQPTAQTQARIAGQLRALPGSDNTLLVAERAGGVVGYVFVHWLPNLLFGGEGYVSELFLRPEARSQGTGAALLAEVQRLGRERGCERLMLFNHKQRESYQRGFYPKHGWVERDDTALFMYDLDDAP